MILPETQRAKEQQAKLSSKMILKGRIVTVKQDTYAWEDGSSHICDIILHPGAVAILPIAADGKLLLIRQWRRATGEILIEIPAGILEKGEEISACALRELQEEIGYSAKVLEPLGTFFSAPGFCNEKIYIYLASDLIESLLPGDEHEAIELYPVELKEALKMIETGRIVDAKTIIAILRYARRKGV